METLQCTNKNTQTHHILLLPPSIDVALALQQHTEQSISNDNEPTYIVDAFSSAATKYSRDEETALKVDC